MIEKILEMLQISDFMGESEAIDIAKGKYKTQDTLKGFKKQIKRAKSWQ
jgi:hypothetical protein|tara:strand:- start:179 stop:325 length:147 start_codon:yes stop_codon:yes gene_type:complete